MHASHPLPCQAGAPNRRGWDFIHPVPRPCHAHGIINELTRLVRERLTPPMHFVKLEGGAVFCYANADSFEDGERFVELLEACYLAPTASVPSLPVLSGKPGGGVRRRSVAEPAEALFGHAR